MKPERKDYSKNHSSHDCDLCDLHDLCKKEELDPEVFACYDEMAGKDWVWKKKDQYIKNKIQKIIFIIKVIFFASFIAGAVTIPFSWYLAWRIILSSMIGMFLLSRINVTVTTKLNNK